MTESVQVIRGIGKTTKLIEIAGKEWYYIVCLDHQRIDSVVKKAKELGIDIPYPITISHFIDGQFANKGGIKGFLIDDVDDVLRYFGRGIPVIAISLTGDV